jgi:hypothetical protein
MKRCPICGYDFRGGWSQCDSGHIFEQSTDTLVTAGMGASPLTGSRILAAAVPAGVTMERRRPARAADLRSDVVVPFIQATITGLLGTVGGSALAMLVNLAGANLDIAIVGGAAGLITAGAMWWVLLQEHRDLLWEIETRTGIDLDGDGKAGVPTTTRLEVTIPATEQSGQQTLILDGLNAKPEQLRTWARGMLQGRMAESEWYGKGRLFSKGQFYALRQEFIDRGLMAWINPDAHAQGTELTAVGRAVCRWLAA